MKSKGFNFAFTGLLFSLILPIDAQIITTYAGNGFGAGQGFGSYSGDGGQATSAGLSNPFSTAVDASGNVYIADRGNNVIRIVNASGTISTYAGNGTAGYSGNGGIATAAQLNGPSSVRIGGGGGNLLCRTRQQCNS